jgi:hypothetical protein
VKKDVRTAIDEVTQGFPGHELRELEDDEGGAYVIVEKLDLGDRYAPTVSWVGFHVTHPYPDADVYPHFLRGDLTYSGSGALEATGWPESMAPNQVMPGFNLAAIQVSRRSNHWNPDRDTAALKLTRVLDWIRSHS